MLNLDWNIVWTIVNILVLFLLLKHFLFKPITEMMESRTAEIENNLKDAEDQKQKASELTAQYGKSSRGPMRRPLRLFLRPGSAASGNMTPF